MNGVVPVKLTLKQAKQRSLLAERVVAVNIVAQDGLIVAHAPKVNSVVVERVVVPIVPRVKYKDLRAKISVMHVQPVNSRIKQKNTLVNLVPPANIRDLRENPVVLDVPLVDTVVLKRLVVPHAARVNTVVVERVVVPIVPLVDIRYKPVNPVVPHVLPLNI